MTASTATPRLLMRGIEKHFGPTTALAGVDLSVNTGEVCGLVGENGAGKSTLMGILAGATSPDAGSMSLDGHDYTPSDPMAARRAGVAMIHQELSLAPDLTVAENILLGVEPTRGGAIDRRAMRQAAQQALAELSRGDIDPDRPASTLSVAEQQLVEIARAVAVGSRVLVFDEPTSSLDCDRAAKPSSTSRISSKKFARSAIALWCCATAAWPAGAIARWRRRRSCA
jgi:ribose transport system ATP-binding protein